MANRSTVAKREAEARGAEDETDENEVVAIDPDEKEAETEVPQTDREDPETTPFEATMGLSK